MPEPFSAEHLNQLRQRWERDPKSRAFLQLAEEYRRAGKLSDAVHVLQAGLKEHPTYLSAQVALGRCLMESGAPEPAAEILERAVARDPTQLVANKLLVEAYLAKGQAAKARERLDLYKLFNDRDAEIEPLENRIRALEGLPPASPSLRSSASAAAAKKLPVREPRSDAPFELPGVAALPELRLESALTPASSLRDLQHAEPFGLVHPPNATARIAEAFAQQGIFPVALAPALPAPAVEPEFLQPAVPTAPTASVRPTEPSPAFELSAAAPAVPETDFSPADPTLLEPTANAWTAEPAPAAEAEWAPEPVESPVPIAATVPTVPPVPIEPPATLAASPLLPVSEAPKAASATLGELYLAQGHFAEAEEAFHSVLQTRPGDAAALAGLESVRQLRGGEGAGFDDEVVEAEESNVIVGGLTARKASLLKDYLARIRQSARRHVS